MLKPAILYKQALPACWAKVSLEPRCRYFTENYWTFDGNIKNDNWNGHQFVSIDVYDNIIGFLAVSVDRSCYYAHSMGALRFDMSGKYDITFAKDFKHFFYLLFYYYKYNKLTFSVCKGSPHEKMYDKFIERYGGRIVGVKLNHWKLQDGTICDLKMYELPRYKFVNHTKESYERNGKSKV
jgi:hypothetical protein